VPEKEGEEVQIFSWFTLVCRPVCVVERWTRDETERYDREMCKRKKEREKEGKRERAPDSNISR